MSKLSAHASATVRSLACETLRRFARREGSWKGKPNVRRATLAALAEATRREWRLHWNPDTAGRFLRRLCHEWREGWQLQERAVRGLALLLDCLQPGTGARIRQLLLSNLAARHARVLRDPGWLEPASSIEVASLLPAVTATPRAADLIDRFRSCAKTRGHDSWVIDASLRRALGPLTGYLRTGGLVRSWDELTPAARLRFLKASLEREKIILGGEPAHLRAMRREANGEPALPPLTALPATRSELRWWLARGRWKKTFPG